MFNINVDLTWNDIFISVAQLILAFETDAHRFKGLLGSKTLKRLDHSLKHKRSCLHPIRPLTRHSHQQPQPPGSRWRERSSCSDGRLDSAAKDVEVAATRSATRSRASSCCNTPTVVVVHNRVRARRRLFFFQQHDLGWTIASWALLDTPISRTYDVLLIDTLHHDTQMFDGDCAFEPNLSTSSYLPAGSL